MVNLSVITCFQFTTEPDQNLLQNNLILKVHSLIWNTPGRLSWYWSELGTHAVISGSSKEPWFSIEEKYHWSYRHNDLRALMGLQAAALCWYPISTWVKRHWKDMHSALFQSTLQWDAILDPQMPHPSAFIGIGLLCTRHSMRKTPVSRRYDCYCHPQYGSQWCTWSQHLKLFLHSNECLVTIFMK